MPRMNRILSFLSLRVLIISLVGLLVGAALFFAVNGLQQSRQTYLNEKQLVEQSQLTNDCLQSASHFSVERIQISTVLLKNIPINERNAKLIDQQRQDADKQAKILLASLTQKYPKKADHLKGLWTQLKELRTEFDTGFNSQTLDPSFRWRWKATSSALISYLEVLQSEVWDISALFNAGLIDAGTEHLDRMRYLALSFKKLSNLEANILTDEYSSEQALSGAIISTLRDLRARSIYFWSELDREVRRSSEDLLKIKIEFQGVERELFGGFYPIQDKILLSAEAGQYAKPDIETYFNALSSASEAIDRLESSIARAGTAYATQRFEMAGRHELFSIISIVMILILAILVQYLLVQRFTRPLHAIMDHINRLKDISNQPLEKNASVSGDEFACVQRALVQLDKAIEARLKSEQALYKVEQINSLILAGAPMAIIITSVDGLITMFNPGAEAIFGYARGEAIGKDICSLIFDPKQMQERAEKLSEALGQKIESDFSFFSALSKFNHTIQDTEWALACKDGSFVSVLLSITLLSNSEGQITGYLGVFTDITERKKIEETLLQNTKEIDKQNNLLNALVKTVPVGILMIEAPSQKPLIVNDSALHILGMQRDQLVATYSTYKFPTRTPYPMDELPMHLGMLGVSSRVDDLLVILPNGEERILQVTGTPVKDAEGQLWACVVCLVDITERSKEVAEMSRLAYLDHLTQLPNRRLFYDRLQMAITKARREQEHLAIMSIDLDKFKPVNDNLGHAVGDLLLHDVAKRMQQCLRASDTLARIGGDEFAIILPSIDNTDDAIFVAEKIREALNKPFELEGNYTISIACCIGIAMYPDHGREEKILMEHADEAMYEAKKQGRNCVRLAKTLSIQEHTGDEALFLPRKWHYFYISGDEEVDTQHRELFDQTNELISLYNADKNQTERMLAIVDKIIGCAPPHFSTEENLLATLGYPGLEEHILKHQRLAARLRELRSEVVSGKRPIGDILLFITRDIVNEHMLVEDLKYFSLLKASTQKKCGEEHECQGEK